MNGLLSSRGGEGEASASSLSSCRHSELRFCLRRRLRCFLRVAARAGFKSCDAFVDGGIETFLANFAREPNLLKDFAQGWVGMGNFQCDTVFSKFHGEGVQGFRRSDVDVSDRLRIENEPANRCGTRCDEGANAGDKMCCIRK